MKIKLLKKLSKSGVRYYQEAALVGDIELVFAVFLDKQGKPSRHVKVSYWSCSDKSYVEVSDHFKLIRFTTANMVLEIEQLAPIKPVSVLPADAKVKALETKVEALEGKVDEILSMMRIIRGEK